MVTSDSGFRTFKETEEVVKFKEPDWNDFLECQC